MLNDTTYPINNNWALHIVDVYTLYKSFIIEFRDMNQLLLEFSTVKSNALFYETTPLR